MRFNERVFENRYGYSVSASVSDKKKQKEHTIEDLMNFSV